MAIFTNGVGHEASSDSDRPAEKEGDQDASVLTQQQWLQSIVEAKIHPPVDEDANSRDRKASVEPLDTVRFEGLHIDID